MDFSVEQNKKLIERYPFLMPRNIWTNEAPEDYDYSYIQGIGCIPEGWNSLFLQMCEDIRQPLIDANYLEKFKFSQIKEKYGSMRCYNFGAPSTVLDIIDKYEFLSTHICCRCGKPATKETLSWIYPYCDECMPENETYEPIKQKLIMHMSGSGNGRRYDKYIDCSDEWNRLFKKN